VCGVCVYVCVCVCVCVVCVCVCVCVCVDFGVQHAMLIRHIVMCDLPGSKFFPHYLIKVTIFEKSY